ncbi:hypothetical protein MFIFM68171_10417 [Madurella fahalii]|uniref:Uncharacterized protein n=1 Tax=Madurella fahalii TaxID=1157608 RepID=A0ABQ0GR38_9PEZI
MADFAYRTPPVMANERWLSSRSPIYNNSFYNARFETGSTPSLPQSLTYTHGAASTNNLPASLSAGGAAHLGRAAAVEPAFPSPTACNPRLTQGPYASPPPSGQMPPHRDIGSWSWDHQSSYQGNHQGNHQGSHQGPYQGAYQGQYQGRYSPSDSMDDLVASPNLSDYSLENAAGGPPPPQNSKPKMSGKPRSQRRPSNRDEFDGPHQFLKRPPPEYIAMQERELPHLPTHLLVQEQDSVLTQVNDRLSQCAYDFVAKYQFPIPLTQDMRPVERPRDREWTEWVFLLKRLATKRRIPARVLYNGQIKQFVTILENSLEMRHAAKQGSRPLKDDRNILQLISAGIQVAKILKDAQAMDYLDRLYVSTEQQIQERAAASAAAAAAAARFR